MAIDTNTEKLALIEWDQVFEPGLPLSPGSLDTRDRQQLIWGYPGLRWAGLVDNAKLANMEWCQVFEPGIPVSPGDLGQDDKQQLLWGYPDVAWQAPAAAQSRPVGQFVHNVGRLMTR